MTALRGLEKRLAKRARFERLVLDNNFDDSPVYPPLHLRPITTAPTDVAEGDVYYNGTDNTVEVYTGSAFESLLSADTTTTQTLAGALLGPGLVEVVTAATDVLSASQSGTTFILSRTGGIDVTLPAIAAAQVGTRFRFIIGLAASSDTYTITAASGDLLTGRVIALDTDTANTVTSFAPDGSDDLIITFSDSADLPGSFVDLIATSATSWMVTGVIYHTGNSATPFS